VIKVLRNPANRDGEDLWAITCYFNAAGYRRRLANYRVFRERLIVPLVTVELAYGDDFELDCNDAEVLVRLRGKDVLWQKERLLNIALNALPDSCRKVVWLDCDVIFQGNDWPRRTSLLLERFKVVQPFSHLYLLPHDWDPDEERPPGCELQRSAPFLIASGMPVATCMGTPGRQIGCPRGLAWAAGRDLLREHCFYDVCIIGGGDSAMLRAAYGCFDDAIRIQAMNSPQRIHYLAWAEAFHDAVRSNVGFVEGNLVHLWHGNLEHRRYGNRYQELTRFQFDPFEDIAIDNNGAWRWNTNKTEMHDCVSAYFLSRREDG
jgi:hypothetical protein